MADIELDNLDRQEKEEENNKERNRKQTSTMMIGWIKA